MMAERRRYAKFLASWLVLAGVLLFAALWEADRQEQVRLEAFRRELGNLAKISETIMADRLLAYDHTLLDLRKFYADDPVHFHDHVQRLRSGSLSDRDLLVVVVDRDGYLAYTDAPNVRPRLDLGKSLYFRHFADGAEDGFHIAEPLFGRVTQRYTVPLARPIRDRNGGFNGVVAISVRQDALADFGPNLHLSGDATVTVVTRAGSVVTRSQDLATTQGTKIPPQLLAQLVANDQGVFSSSATPDGQERTIAGHHIDGTPLIIYVAASDRDVRRVTAQQRLVLMAGAGFASLLALLVMLGYLQNQQITARFIATQQAHLREAQRIAEMGSWELDLATKRFQWSDALYRLFGVARENFVSDLESFLSLVDEPDRGALKAEFERTGVAATGDLEFRLRRGDGELRNMVARGEVVRNKAGQATSVIGTVRDITDRKLAEETLRKSEERLKAVFEASSDAIGVSCRGRHVMANRSYFQLFGIKDLAELKAVSVIDLIAPSERERIREYIARRGESTALPTHYETRGLRTDGREFPMDVNASTYSEAGDLYTVVIIRDVTDRKLSELEIENHRHHLEKMVESRTAELVAAKEAAETASIAKSAFLANMSHEIRTPMNGILGMANILRREGVSPKQAQRLDTIDTSAQHLLGIINNILDLSKIEAGKLELEEAPVAVGSLLTNVSSILAERARAKGLRLLIEAGSFPHNLVGDPTRLQQALLNYAVNAVKFTEQGSVTLRTLVQGETDDAAVLRFEVQDTGIGVGAEVMPRLFSAFEQADNSMTRKYGGTGLGLAITRRLAELMGGEVGADSTAGAGSTFWFTVKLKKGAEQEENPMSTDGDAETLLRQRYSGRRILVADDEPINREVAQMQLEAVDLVVDTAEDGAEAVMMAQRTVYTAIFMDMQMPNLNGLKATEQIRRLPGYGQTPIIAMTANAFAEDKARCFEAGMNEFLVKPFDPDTLFATLLRALTRRDA